MRLSCQIVFHGGTVFLKYFGKALPFTRVEGTINQNGKEAK